ncbi:ribosome biogenesis protein WDR12 homolog [Hetaerina americana]|uniref:ribosome biogenesis protein WDR12 homolog n=1 Tax=Hetaerina americana TaxID=62018 RepID=UPI003A7F29AA
MASSLDAPDQIQIRFLSKQERYAVPDTPFSVPSNITCEGLNTLVNELRKENRRGEEDDEVEFDFLVCQQFLRATLCEHLVEREVSSELVVDVEYVERHPPPQPHECLMHDDWVSAVEACENWILTGCYDNTIQIWTSNGKHCLTITGHNGAVKGVTWLKIIPGLALFASSSQDQTAMVWEWNMENNSVHCAAILKGHERSLECVAGNKNSEDPLVATGGWDTNIKLWSSSLDSPGDERNDHTAAKKMKLSESKCRTPKATLKGHREAVSGVQWIANDELVSSSWDHTVRIWDVDTHTIKQEISGNKSIFDISWSPLSRCLVTASADRHVRLYDPRSTEGSLIKGQYTSHTAWVQSVGWSSVDEFNFISGGYDNQVKLWDTRSPKAPLFDLTGHEDKVLCCDWSNPKLMASGGADCTLRTFRARQSNG